MEEDERQYAVGGSLTGIVHLVKLGDRLAPETMAASWGRTNGAARGICGTLVKSIRGSRYDVSARVILEDDLTDSRLCKRCSKKAAGLDWVNGLTEVSNDV